MAAISQGYQLGERSATKVNSVPPPGPGTAFTQLNTILSTLDIISGQVTGLEAAFGLGCSIGEKDVPQSCTMPGMLADAQETTSAIMNRLENICGLVGRP